MSNVDYSPIYNIFWYKAIEGQTADSLQTDVQRVHSSNDVAAGQQFREADLRASRRLAQVVRRYGVRVQPQVRARVYPR